MKPRIQTITEKKLAGKRLQTSLAENKTHELWGSFMPRRKEISNAIGSELYSVQFFEPAYFTPFNAATTFEKWAAVEVTDFTTVPAGLETLTIPGGLYAVFLHSGPASAAMTTFQFIYNTWLPGSGYVLDHRPHFEVMGEKYKQEAEDSEEEFWIPVKLPDHD